MFVCVCVREREQDRVSECVYMCVCVCVYIYKAADGVTYERRNIEKWIRLQLSTVQLYFYFFIFLSYSLHTLYVMHVHVQCVRLLNTNTPYVKNHMHNKI